MNLSKTKIDKAGQALGRAVILSEIEYIEFEDIFDELKIFPWVFPLSTIFSLDFLPVSHESSLSLPKKPQIH